ncbi:MAG TPA: acetoacetate--CoA ligase [Solirubrobacterales bacterium]|nr:acetoacetate--CoA ligase [Solirubrobacterales bacterium]
MAAGSGEVLWDPPPAARERTRVADYMRWLERERGLGFADYDELWRWSVTELEPFWGSIWDYFGVISHAPAEEILTTREMPGARWFVGAKLNYAEQALAVGEDDAVAIVAHSQTRDPVELTYRELRGQVARARAGLARLGVGRGDRVAAYLPTVPETVVAFLATVSLGAIWAASPPEFGVRSVVDRLGQLDPKVLLVVDGYRYAGKTIDRRRQVEEIQAQIPSIESTVWIPYLDGAEGFDLPAGAFTWAELLDDSGPLAFEPVEFSDPLWVLFSSGTTGLPKAIVHSHGGIVVEHLKSLALQHDIGAGDRFLFYSTTAWMVWNLVTSTLLLGAGSVILDGNPVHPDMLELWRLAAETGVTHLGASSAFLMGCRKAGLMPGRELDLDRLRFLVAAGSPLPADGYRWIYEHLDRERVFLTAGSGGTDVCSGFVGAVPVAPVHAGEMTGKQLGAGAEAYDTEGRSVVDELGELVITAPMPSMPIGFCNDADGRRYREAYFEMYPGVWRHGDWIMFTSHGTSIITGRSDATLNRGGVRLGTSELCEVVESVDGVADSLVVHLEPEDGSGLGELLLFIVAAPGADPDEAMFGQIKAALRTELSPRHVPDSIYRVDAVPRTITGKKLEVPVKKILQGADPDAVASRGALADPAAIDAYVEIARARG